jgi:hypothetical protein
MDTQAPESKAPWHLKRELPFFQSPPKYVLRHILS